MKHIIIAAALLLGACAGKPDVPDIGPGAPPPEAPALPDSLRKKAERLPDITDPTMGGSHLDGIETDKKYNKVAWQLNTLIDLYECVRISIRDRTDPKICMNNIVLK